MGLVGDRGSDGRALSEGHGTPAGRAGSSSSHTSKKLPSQTMGSQKTRQQQTWITRSLEHGPQEGHVLRAGVRVNLPASGFPRVFQVPPDSSKQSREHCLPRFPTWERWVLCCGA